MYPTLFLLLSLMHNLQDGRRSSSDFESADSGTSEVVVVVVVVGTEGCFCFGGLGGNKKKKNLISCQIFIYLKKLLGYCVSS